MLSSAGIGTRYRNIEGRSDLSLPVYHLSVFPSPSSIGTPNRVSLYITSRIHSTRSVSPTKSVPTKLKFSFQLQSSQFRPVHIESATALSKVPSFLSTDKLLAVPDF